MSGLTQRAAYLDLEFCPWGLLSLNELHCGDRTQEEDRGNAKGMNGEPTHRKDRINDGLIGIVANHRKNLISIDS